MEPNNTIELRDEKIYPDKAVLKRVLGKSFQAYGKLLELFDKNDMHYEWRYYRDGKAWLCKVQKKKRTIIWMSAWKGHMKATMYFPEKYIDKVYGLDIAERVKKKIHETKNVGKSKPCTFEIANNDVLGDFEKVMHLKIACK